MPEPVEICLEDLDDLGEEKYLRCVALPDAEPGLVLDDQGGVHWMPSGDVAHGLWVSGDDRLILIRAAEAGPLGLERGGRGLQVPAGKPVVLRDQDLLLVGERRLRLHIHGVTDAVYPPERVPLASLQRLARSTAAALALGAATAAAPIAQGQTNPAGEPPPIEVRARPPKVAPPRHKVDCSITSLKRDKKGMVFVSASCPTDLRIGKGMRGILLDQGKKPIEGVVVVVKENRKGKIKAEGKSDKALKARYLRFMVRR